MDNAAVKFFNESRFYKTCNLVRATRPCGCLRILERNTANATRAQVRIMVFANKTSISPAAPELIELSFKMFDSDSIIEKFIHKNTLNCCVCSYQYTPSSLQFTPSFHCIGSGPLCGSGWFSWSPMLCMLCLKYERG